MISPRYRSLYLPSLFFFWVQACSPEIQKIDREEDAYQKITFDLTGIDEQGLIGPSDGKVLIAYIFRIPNERSKRKELVSIDPSLRVFKRNGEDHYTCIGEGGNPALLIRLARLPYVKKIDRFYGE